MGWSVAVRPAETPLDKYARLHWSDANGLPQNTVNAALQGNEGFMWIGTAEGLARFDGKLFRVFDTANTPEMGNNLVWSLHEGRDGSLWAGSWAGLARMKDGRWSRLTTIDGLWHNTVRALGESGDGTLWIGTEGGLNALLPDGTLAAYAPEDGEPVRNVRALLADDDGVWIATETGGLLHFRDGRFSRYTVDDGLPSSELSSLARDDSGALWIGTRRGLARFSDGAFTHLTSAHGLTNNHVRRLYRDGYGTLWIATGDHRLHRLKDGRIEVFPESFDAKIRVLTGDREGGVWVGTTSTGISRLHAPALTMIDRRHGLSHPLVWSIAGDSDGKVWIGTASGLNRYDPEADRITEQPEPLAGEVISHMTEDRDGRLWVGTPSGLWLRDNGQWNRFTTADGLSGSSAKKIMQDRAGRIWAGTERGLNSFEQGRIIRLSEPNGPRGISIHALRQGADGTILAGTEEGLHLLPPAGRWREFEFGPEWLGKPVMDALYDADGRLWVATHGAGLIHARDGVIQRARAADGLCDDVLFHFLEDASGYFWTSSNRGICRVARDDLEAFFDGRADTIPAVAFGAANGMNTSETSGGARWQDPDDRIWLGTANGAVVIDPRKLNPVPPPLIIEDVNLGQGWLPAHDGLRVTGSPRELRIRFAAPSFQYPEKIRLQYRLQGLEEHWVETGETREVNYAGIAPGRYVFQARAANSDGVWNETGARFEFAVAPLFYQTWWFYGFCAVLLIAAGALGGHWRRKELAERRRALEAQVAERTSDLEQALAKVAEQTDALHELDRAKSHFFANISHEFRTPLTVILGGLRENLEGRFGKLPTELEKQHHTMLRNTRRLQLLIGQILDLNRLEAGRLELEPEPGCVVEFLKYLVEAQSLLADRNGVDLQLECDTETCPRLFDRDKLEKVAGNIVANALKFTPRGGRVRVVLECTDPIAISVIDTGPGIPPDVQQHVFDRFYRAGERAQIEGTGIGLALALELAQLHGGNIELDSMPGQGSTFTIRLPLEKAEALGESIAAEATPTVRANATCRSGFSREQNPAAGRGSVPDERGVSPHRENKPSAVADQTTILIIEDHDDVRAYVRRTLADRYRIIEATDGERGLSLARDALPDLIVSDIMLPGIDGFGIVRELKADPGTGCIPVIMLTARAADADQAEGYDSGAETYLTKPFDPDTLRAAVARLLAERRRLREKLAGSARRPDTKPTTLEERARAIIMERLYHEHFGVDQLATALAMSRSRLYREMKARTGDSPAALIRSTRLEYARDLLGNGAGSVSEVAYAVGFKSLSHFTRSFQTHFEQSPSRYL